MPKLSQYLGIHFCYGILQSPEPNSSEKELTSLAKLPDIQNKQHPLTAPYTNNSSTHLFVKLSHFPHVDLQGSGELLTHLLEVAQLRPI